MCDAPRYRVPAPRRVGHSPPRGAERCTRDGGTGDTRVCFDVSEAGEMMYVTKTLQCVFDAARVCKIYCARDCPLRMDGRCMKRAPDIRGLVDR